MRFAETVRHAGRWHGRMAPPMRTLEEESGAGAGGHVECITVYICTESFGPAADCGVLWPRLSADTRWRAPRARWWIVYYNIATFFISYRVYFLIARPTDHIFPHATRAPFLPQRSFFSTHRLPHPYIHTYLPLYMRRPQAARPRATPKFPLSRKRQLRQPAAACASAASCNPASDHPSRDRRDLGEGRARDPAPTHRDRTADTSHTSRCTVHTHHSLAAVVLRTSQAATTQRL